MILEVGRGSSQDMTVTKRNSQSFLFVKQEMEKGNHLHVHSKKKQKNKTSWWLNQPIWKICSSNWIMKPQGSGWKQKIFELPPPRKTSLQIFHHPQDPWDWYIYLHWSHKNTQMYVYTPRTPMTSIFEGQPSKTRPLPTKTRVILVPGIYQSHGSVMGQPIPTSHLIPCAVATPVLAAAAGAVCSTWKRSSILKTKTTSDMNHVTTLW